MRKTVDAFLWRIVNQATVDTLIGESKGQYDIRLTKIDYMGFFRGLAQQDPTDLGGFDVVLPIQSFTGPGAVEQSTLRIRFIGPRSQRKDWYIRAQRPETAYPLWRQGRGFAGKEDIERGRHYIVIARDVDNGFHARWIQSGDFDSLPAVMRQHMANSEAGWCNL